MSPTGEHDSKSKDGICRAGRGEGGIKIACFTSPSFSVTEMTRHAFGGDSRAAGVICFVRMNGESDKHMGTPWLSSLHEFFSGEKSY